MVQALVLQARRVFSVREESRKTHWKVDRVHSNERFLPQAQQSLVLVDGTHNLFCQQSPIQVIITKMSVEFETRVDFPFLIVYRLLLGWSMPPKFTLLKLLRQKVVPEEQVIKENFIVPETGIKV